MIKSQTHRKVIGGLFIALALYLVTTIFGMYFENHPLWQKIIICALVPLYLLAGFSQLKNKSWGIWVSLPISLAMIVIFPIGTFLSAYLLWALIKLENDSEEYNNRFFKKLACLKLLDYFILTFLCCLIPYGALAGHTIGGANFFATAISLLFCCVGVISKIISKSKLAWVYVLLAIIPVCIFIFRKFEAGYGP
ncbi:MAG: hypothetical protein IH984_10960 [Planctomycetes bacterium]|nr:hypothetical protein [Planctomycetota bacterium]